MAQNSDILLSSERYSRADFTALRAWLNKLSIGQISSLYYTEDDLLALGCAAPADLAHRLEAMRDTLILRASETNPHAADALRTARRAHVWSRVAIDYLVQAADRDMLTPRLADPVSVWFKPRLASSLQQEGLQSLADLKATIQRRGSGWWKPFMRIGAGKAAILERWWQQQAASLGQLNLRSEVISHPEEIVVLSPDDPKLLPLERVGLPLDLDGREGFNRHTAFALISARNDLEAIDCYLYKFRGQEKTSRAYRKELERFLLWCIYERRKAMSSILTDDCEAYKDFLQAPKAQWIGPKAKRLSADWKPFAGRPSPASQRYAVQAVRGFFQWLVNVRYLSGNPWMTVADPAIARSISPMQIEKALPEALWQKLIDEGGLLDLQGQRDDDELREIYRLRGSAARIALSAQFRLVRAALLLLGDSGLRREEAAYATRDRLKPVPGTPGLWEMDILGKRAKWRTVFLPQRAITALEAHWRDRGQDFSFTMADLPLLSPLVAPPTADAQNKHFGLDGEMMENGFTEDGLYRVIKTALIRIADDPSLPLDEGERQLLRHAGPHAFRHTFGSQAAAGLVPLDVLQRVLGHTSLQTTTIYVQAEKKRSIEELGKFFKKY